MIQQAFTLCLLTGMLSIERSMVRVSIYLWSRVDNALVFDFGHVLITREYLPLVTC